MALTAFTRISKHSQNKINAVVSLIASLHRSISLNKAVPNLFKSPNTGLREMFLHCKKRFQKAKVRLVHRAPLSQLEKWMWNLGSKQLMKFTDVLSRIWIRVCRRSVERQSGGHVSGPQDCFVDWDQFWREFVTVEATWWASDTSAVCFLLGHITVPFTRL